EAELDELVDAETGHEQAVPQVIAVAGDAENAQAVDQHRDQRAEEQSLQQQAALFLVVEGVARHQAGTEVGRAIGLHAQPDAALFAWFYVQRKYKLAMVDPAPVERALVACLIDSFAIQAIGIQVIQQRIAYHQNPAKRAFVRVVYVQAQ